MFGRFMSTMHLLVEPKFRIFYNRFKDKEFNLLDIGCGNHSPTRTKGVFKSCRYFGIDKDLYNNSEKDVKAMDIFYQLDLTENDLSELPDDFFDVIIMYHVLEHIPNGLSVVSIVSRKLKAGGVIYVEFPSVRSLGLPSVEGTLHFCDDSSHVKLYDVKDVANVLLSKGCKIVKAGPRRDKIGMLIAPLFYLYLKYLKRVCAASALWDITGFADYVYAEKIISNDVNNKI